MGTAPYTRTVYWTDPRSEGSTDDISRLAYERMKANQQMLAQKVRFDGTCLEGVFELMRNHAGVDMMLSKKSFSAVMEEIGVAQAYHDELFIRVDADNSGNIDTAEFCEVIDSFVNGSHHFKVLRSCFSIVDVQCTGKVTKDELDSFHRHQTINKGRDKGPTEAQLLVISKIFRQIASGNRALSFNDFVTACSEDSSVLVPFMNHILSYMCKHLIGVAPESPKAITKRTEDQSARLNVEMAKGPRKRSSAVA